MRKEDAGWIQLQKEKLGHGNFPLPDNVFQTNIVNFRGRPSQLLSTLVLLQL